MHVLQQQQPAFGRIGARIDAAGPAGSIVSRLDLRRILALRLSQVQRWLCARRRHQRGVCVEFERGGVAGAGGPRSKGRVVPVSGPGPGLKWPLEQREV